MAETPRQAAGLLFQPAPMKGSGGEHAQAHLVIGIGYLDAHLGGANGRIKKRIDFADRAFDHAIGIGIQADIGSLAYVNRRQIILVNITDDPYVREIGDGKSSRRPRISNTGSGRIGYILRDDHTRRRGIYLHRQ